MGINEIQVEAATMAEMYLAVKRALEGQSIQVSEDTLKSLTATMYIQGGKSKQSASQGYKKPYNGNNNSNNNQQKRKGGMMQMPDGQIKAAGEPCVACGTPLKVSKQGNVYCPCWYNN